MDRKILFVLCAQAVFANIIFAQCFGNGINPGLNLGIGNGIGLAGNGIGIGNNIGLANGLGYGNIGLGANPAAVSNSGFTVTSASPIAPSGVSVLSEYVIEGPVNVGGQLPLLGTVALEGQVPTGGSAGTQYSCGNGNVGIVSETGAAGIGSGVIGNGVSGIGIGNNFGIGNGLANGFGNGVGINRLGGCGL